MRDSIFFSYSHKDGKMLAEIETMLAPALKELRQLKIDTWSDRKIKPGMKWKEEIAKALERAKVAVLLVSPDFLASKYVVDNELPPILQTAQKDGLTVVWIYLRPALYRSTDIADFQAAHDVTKPLSTLTAARRGITMVEICERILETCRQ